MAHAHNLTDPTDLDGLRRYLKVDDPEGLLMPLEMLRVIISDDAHLRLAMAPTSTCVLAGTGLYSAVLAVFGGLPSELSRPEFTGKASE